MEMNGKEKKRMRCRLLLIALFIVIFASGCKEGTIIESQVIEYDTIWNKTIIVTGDIIVAPQATLIIEPGTTIKFLPLSKRNLTAEDAETAKTDLIIKGRLMAIGELNAPITFQPYVQEGEEYSEGTWGGIILYNCRESKIGYARISGAIYGIYAENCQAKIARNRIFKNQYGIYFKNAKLQVEYNEINKNGYGIAYIDCKSNVTYNKIIENRIGLYYAEKSSSNEDTSILRNNIYDNLEYNFALGPTVNEDVIVIFNWWGTNDLEKIHATLYDKKNDPNLGAINIDPPLNAMLPHTGLD